LQNRCKAFDLGVFFYYNGVEPAIYLYVQQRRMMNGHKARLFLLYLSFIGWAILACIPFGIGFFWLTPYVSLSVANFYEDLKNTNHGAYEAISSVRNGGNDVI
jgi:uncharacterized membrane protein